jgi:hypothetical protein
VLRFTEKEMVRWPAGLLLLIYLFPSDLFFLLPPGFRKKKRRRKRKSLGGFQNTFQTFQILNFVSNSLQRFANIIV